MWKVRIIYQCKQFLFWKYSSWKVMFLSASDSFISWAVILKFLLLCPCKERKCEAIRIPGLAAVRRIHLLIDCGVCQSPVLTIPEHVEGRIELSLTSPSYLQLVNMLLARSNDLGMGKYILPLNKSHWRFSEKCLIGSVTNWRHLELFQRDSQMLGRCYCLLT